MIKIDIDETQPIKNIIQQVKKHVLNELHEKQSKSMTAIAKQIGVSYKTLYNWIAKEAYSIPALQDACIFCGSKKDLVLHHTRGRKNGPDVIFLCDTCHKTFHALELKFRI